MADDQNGQDKRFYFSRGQLVILVVGFTIAAVIIYFLGVLSGLQMAGRGIVGNVEPRVRIPVQPLIQDRDSSSEPEAPAQEKLALYDTLTKPPGAEPSVKGQARESRQLEKPAKAETKKAMPPVKESASTTAEKAPDKVGEKPAVRSLDPKEPQAAQTAQRKEAVKMWTVQVSAFADETSAGDRVSELKTKGYDAFMVEANVKGQTWYRVRVGRFSTRKEAEALRKILSSKEGFGDAFLARQ